MDTINALPLGRKLILGAGVLLFIDLFLHWQSYSFEGHTLATRSGWHGFWGILLGLLTLALIGWVAARAFDVALPVNLPDGLVTLGLGVLILLFAVIKNLDDDYSAWASYVGIVLAAAVAYGAWLVFQASGETLPRVSQAGSPDTAVAPPPTTTPPEDPGV